MRPAQSPSPVHGRGVGVRAGFRRGIPHHQSALDDPRNATQTEALCGFLPRHPVTNPPPDYRAMLDTAIKEARQGLAEGGIPIGAALYHRDGRLLGRGHNRRVQENDPSVHGETDAFRKAGRQRSYRDTIMVTTLAPCWYCSGLVRQFGIGTVVVGESVNFDGGVDWLRENGVEVVDLADPRCIKMLGDWIATNPEVWNEDIGEL